MNLLPACGCQEEDIVEFLNRAGLEHRELGGDFLADDDLHSTGSVNSRPASPNSMYRSNH